MWHTLSAGVPRLLESQLTSLQTQLSFPGKGATLVFFPLGRFYQVGQKRHDRGPLVQSVLLSGWFSNFSTKKKPPGELV